MNEPTEKEDDAATEILRYVEARIHDHGLIGHADIAVMIARHRDGLDAAKWLEWSGGNYPEDTPGDVIAAWPDGDIMLDDSLTIWNPLRALRYVAEGGRLQVETTEYEQA